MVYITYLSPAGWDGLVAKARRHQRRQHPCQWVWTLDWIVTTHKPNGPGAIGLVPGYKRDYERKAAALYVRNYVAPCPDCQDRHPMHTY